MPKVTLHPVAARPRYTLPPPETGGGMALAEALARRQSVRDFAARALNVAQLGQLLWAAQGITHDRRGFRAAPSAGGLLPMELDVIAAAVDGIVPGLYRYDSRDHSLMQRRPGDPRRQLAALCAHQDWIADAPCVVVLEAVPQRTSRKYGSHTERYIQMEAGHVAENLLLQAVALGLGACPVGAVPPQPVKELLQLPPQEKAVYLVAVGYPRD